jgi:dTDP-4-dehydrorhamnose reductase
MESMSTETKYTSFNPELWGGIECTINRVGDLFRDQLKATGHYDRPGDIERFARLGIRKLRYPVLWEQHESLDGKVDWRWTRQQLELIRKHGIDPIVGLVHHGSGPAGTDLSDTEFPAKLAAYAAKVAKKFPWIAYYTPVNEPLTTARFSGLYGFWYPHHADELSFTRMLLHQVKAVVLSMEAIRRINPSAKLVQTEDLAKTYSTSHLAYQASFENERRWLTNDLLCGKVDRQHFFWNYFISLGIAQEELQFFLDHPCPPDIMGFNYYVTSERYLDERIENYNPSTHGGNGRDRYADTEAVRVQPLAGIDTLLKEAWERFGLPLAVTECHLSCTREEQLRWFRETWDRCSQLKQEGVDVRAVTAWSLLGACDWNSLLMRQDNYYEPGVFDVQQQRIRPTALAKLVHALGTTGDYAHPLLAEPGWWNRIHHHEAMDKKIIHQPAAPLLIIGRNGTLGQAFIRICERRSIPYIILSRQELDISREEDIEKAIAVYKPWAIVNASGYVKVDEAEANSNECFAVNSIGPGLLANACRHHGIRFMTFSSDLVFDGIKEAPYYETDSTNPLNIYGSSKADGEKKVRAVNQEALIIRTSAFFGPWDRYNFVYNVIESLKKDGTIEVPNDVMVSPTYVPDLADAAMDLFIDEESGIWHLTNEGMLTWSEFGAAVAERAGYEKSRVRSKPLIEMGWRAKRPLYSVLQSEKGIKLPALDHALVRYFEQRTV